MKTQFDDTITVSTHFGTVEITYHKNIGSHYDFSSLDGLLENSKQAEESHYSAKFIDGEFQEMNRQGVVRLSALDSLLTAVAEMYAKKLIKDNVK